jgi:hypothetical protein
VDQEYISAQCLFMGTEKSFSGLLGPAGKHATALQEEGEGQKVQSLHQPPTPLLRSTPAIADEHPIVFFFTTGAVDAPIIVHPCM